MRCLYIAFLFAAFTTSALAQQQPPPQQRASAGQVAVDICGQISMFAAEVNRLNETIAALQKQIQDAQPKPNGQPAK